MSTASDQGKCGLSSFFPMSCRDRAEAFARHLHSRLSSLGTEDAANSANETSWLTAHENSVAVSHQPRHGPESNLYLNLELLESPGSPEDEITEREISKLFANNRDNLQVPATSCSYNNGDIAPLNKRNSLSQDSDDLPYFDTDDHIDQKIYVNGFKNSLDNDEDYLEAKESVQGCLNVEDEEESCPDCSINESDRTEQELKESLTSETLSEGVSTLSSPREEECTSLEYCTCTDLAADDDSKSPLDNIFEDETEIFKYPVEQEPQLQEKDTTICDTQKEFKEEGTRDVINENCANIDDRSPENCCTEDELCRLVTKTLIDLTIQDQNQNSIHNTQVTSSSVEVILNEKSNLPPLYISTSDGIDECDACLKIEENNVLRNESEPSLTNGSCLDCQESYKTDEIVSLEDNTINDGNSEKPQQINERIDQKDNEDNPDSTTYSNSLVIDKSLSLEYSVITTNSIEDLEEPPPQTVQELQVLLEETKKLPPDYETEEKEERIPRVRRCSSLKTGKTPPGTPGRKKIVRFADVLGLDLADVRTFLDEIPKIPVSAYEDLKDVEFGSSQQNCSTDLGYPSVTTIAVPDRILMPLFQQPGGQPDFLDRVREKFVCLENAMVKDLIDLSIAGTVRVRNFDFHKSVYIRYTLDGWKTFADLQATYVPNSCDGFSDKFTFLLYAHTLRIGQRLEFAIRFHCKGCQYWDSNSGVNYIFQCLPGNNNVSYLSEPSTEETWGSSFY